MDTARDASGRRYLLLERSAESSRVRDPRTGEERSVSNDDLELVAESALEAVGRAVPSVVRHELGGVRDDRTIGLLREIGTREPVGVVTLLDAYDLCESDLHGTVGELRAAGLIEPADIDDPVMAGERGYRTTETAREAFRSRGKADEPGDESE